MIDDSGLRVGVERQGNAVVIAPQGDVDLSRSPALRSAIREAQASKPARLVIDLAGVDYMDSSGVATLVEALQIARRGGTRLALCGLKDRVRSIFEIARLDSVFAIRATREAALAD